MGRARAAVVAVAVAAALAGVPGTQAAGPVPPVAPPAYAGDFDGDGVADLYFPGAGTRHERLQFGTESARFLVEHVPMTGTYTPLVGDFDGDGHDDVFHYRPGGEADPVWYGGADRGMSQVVVQVRGRYHPAVGDFDGDGRDDVLWYAPGRTSDFVWYGRASRTFRSFRTRADLVATPAVGDFDADGREDIRWYTQEPGDGALWYAKGAGAFETVAAVAPDVGYRPVVGDFDGEGTDDVLWYRTGGGVSYVELGSRLRTPRRVDLTLPGRGDVAVGDFNGDLSDDVLVSGARAVVAYGSPAGLFTGAGITPPRGLRPVAGNFDGDRYADVYWGGLGADRLWRGEALRRFTESRVTVRQNRVAPLDPAVWETAYDPMAYVAHAMGGVNGRAYTNSREAFEQNYAKGFRVFEVDFITLKDGTIMALHNGTEPALGLDKPYREATYAEVRGRKYLGRYTVLTGNQVLALMRKHRDVHVVIDTKWSHVEIVKRLLRDAGDPQVARRLLPHIAGQADLDEIRRDYPLQHYVVALYRTQWIGAFDDPEVLAFVRRNKAPAVMMWIRRRDWSQSLAANNSEGRRFSPSFALALQNAGAVVYVHSTSDPDTMAEFVERRVGVYSDGPLGPADDAALLPADPGPLTGTRPV